MNYAHIYTSTGRHFSVAEMPRTAAARAKPINLSQAVRLFNRNDAILALNADSTKLYSSMCLRYGREVRPGANYYPEWMTALHRLGRLTADELAAEIKAHEDTRDLESKRNELDSLRSDAESLGIPIDWNVYNERRAAVGLKAFVPDGYELTAKGKVVKIKEPKARPVNKVKTPKKAKKLGDALRESATGDAAREDAVRTIPL